MAASYQAKNSGVLGRALKVQKLVIPFTVTHNATPASKTITNDEPSILFMNFEGITGISTTTGALQTGETAPSLASATDSTGVMNVCVLIQETIDKVMHLEVISRGTAVGIVKPGVVLAASTGTGGGKSIFANITTGVNFSTTDLDAVLVVEYSTVE